VKEINIENNDGKDCQSMKEECFQGIVSESRIFNEETNDFFFKLESPHPIKDKNIL